MSPNDDSKKVQIEIIFTIIAGIVGSFALIALMYVLCLLRHRQKEHQLRQQQQQQGTTIRSSPRVKTTLSRHRQQQASSRRQLHQQYVLSTPPQPDDTYSIDSSGTIIELQQRFNSSSGLRSVESNSSYMADMFSLTSDMILQQSSPTSSTLSPPRPPPHQYPFSSNHKSSDDSTGMNNFIPNFTTLPMSSASAIILNNRNDTSTAGDDNDDDFDEVWSYVATDVDIGLINSDADNNNTNDNDIQSIVTANDDSAVVQNDTVGLATVALSAPTDDDIDGIVSSSSLTIIHKPKFVGRSSDGDRNMFEV